MPVTNIFYSILVFINAKHKKLHLVFYLNIFADIFTIKINLKGS